MSHADDLTDRSLPDQQGGRPPRRCPAGVVVHRHPNPRVVCLGEQSWQALQVLRGQGQRLLGQHVLAGRDGRLDPLQAVLGGGRDVHEPDLGVGQELLGAPVDAAHEGKALLDRGRGLGAAAPDAAHAHAVVPVGGQVGGLGDGPTAKDRNARAVVREAGEVSGLSTEWSFTWAPGPPGT
ncbi:MAG: hypothetical protein WKF76_01660 [Nocardioidaceae bacterium]